MDEQHLCELAVDAIESDSDYVGVALRDGAFPQAAIRSVSFDGSLLVKLRGASAVMPSFALSDTIVRECDFSNAIWEKARLTGSQLATCRLTGWNVVGAVLRNVRLTGCKINLGVLQSATLIDCTFESCDLREADFQMAKLKNVAFSGCDLRNARFVAATLGAVDFRGSHLAGICLDADRLAGNTFDPSQLVDLVRILGLVVKDIEPDRRR